MDVKTINIQKTTKRLNPHRQLEKPKEIPPKVRFILSKQMFDTIIQFVDVNGAYEAQLATTLSFEYHNLVILLVKACEKIRSSLSYIQVQLAFLDSLEQLYEENGKPPAQGLQNKKKN